MSDALPDRLSSDPRSPFFDADLLQRGIGIRFNGAERKDVEEYCVSGGWIRVSYGKAKDRRGNPLTRKLAGTVEPYLLDEPASDAPGDTPELSSPGEDPDGSSPAGGEGPRGPS